MGIFGKLFKGPEIDQAKSADSKQKTAYEMRESDWSSDVCSSDLI